jgi:hypothetical protein
MPSARIKTLAVEDAHSLAEDLRTRGFVVEIVPRDKVSSDPVDLEVVLEECEPEAALHRAENIPDAQDLCVFVAPGALTEGNRPMQVVPLFAVPKPAPVIAMTAALTSVVEEKLEDPVALEEPEKLAASELKPPVVVAAAREAPKTVEVPIISSEVWNAPVVKAPARKVEPAWWVGARKTLSVWGKSLAANQQLFRKTATVAAMAAVAAVSVLVLGSTVRRFAPDTQPASASMVLPATASAANTVTEPQELKPLAPERELAAKAKSRRERNPEEDIVAKDYVIHFNKRPAAKAKKTSGVKHYSDLR